VRPTMKAVDLVLRVVAGDQQLSTRRRPDGARQRQTRVLRPAVELTHAVTRDCVGEMPNEVGVLRRESRTGRLLGNAESPMLVGDRAVADPPLEPAGTRVV